MPKYKVVITRTQTAEVILDKSNMDEAHDDAWEKACEDGLWNTFNHDTEIETLKPKYNHMFDVGFSIDTDKEWDEVSKEEMIAALRKRANDLELEAEAGDKNVEAFGYSDSYENFYERRNDDLG